MTLRRTLSGLRNLHIFLRVDRIVYCEGGTQLSIEDVLSGVGADATLDAMYWSGVSQWCGAELQYHFKSVGSKSTLLSIADDAEAMSLDTVIVCMDADFDRHTGALKRRAGVVYSWGYSWENDVVTAEALHGVLASLLPKDYLSQIEVAQLHQQLELSCFELERAVEIDLNLVARGKPALFVRSSPLSLHTVTKVSTKLDRSKLNGRLGVLGYRCSPPRRLRLARSDVWRNGFGKMLARVAYSLVICCAKRRDANINMSFDIFMRLCISQTIEGMTNGRCRALGDYHEPHRETFK